MNVSVTSSLNKLISQELGIVSGVVEVSRQNADPYLWQYAAHVPDFNKILIKKVMPIVAGGSGKDKRQGLFAAVGEVVERYSSQFYFDKDIVRGSYRDLAKQGAIDPKAFSLFHDKQYETEDFFYKRFDPDLKISWVSCLDLTDSKEKLCPAIRIYMSFNEDRNSLLCMQETTGLAAHTDVHKGILTALYEVVERDAFSIAWLQKLQVPKIKKSKELQKLVKSIFPSETLKEYHLFDITLDIAMPTVMGIAFVETDYGTIFSIGSSTRSTYRQAAEKTLIELAQGGAYATYLLKKKSDWTPAHDFSNVNSFERHIGLYQLRKDLWSVFDAWRETEPSVDIDMTQSPKSDIETIRTLIKIFKEKNYSVLFKDMTTVDVYQAGFYCFRIYVPQLIPLSGVYGRYYLGGRRLYDVPKKLGYTTYDYLQLNQYPHPFP